VPRRLQFPQKSSANSCGMHLHASNSWETGANHLPSETWNSFHGLRMSWVSPPNHFPKRKKWTYLLEWSLSGKIEWATISYNMYDMYGHLRTMKYYAHSDPHCLNAELCPQLQKRLLNLDEATTCNDVQWRATTANKCKQPQKISKAYEGDKEKSILWFGQFNVTEDPLTSSSFFKV
jgi:hypothetical protein